MSREVFIDVEVSVEISVPIEVLDEVMVCVAALVAVSVVVPRASLLRRALSASLRARGALARPRDLQTPSTRATSARGSLSRGKDG